MGMMRDIKGTTGMSGAVEIKPTAKASATSPPVMIMLNASAPVQ